MCTDMRDRLSKLTPDSPRSTAKPPRPDRLERATDPLDDKIRAIQESIHDDDDRPSVTVVVQAPKSKPPPAAMVGKVAAGIAALSALGELIHELVRLLGG